MPAIIESLFAHSECDAISRDELGDVWGNIELAARATSGRYDALNEMEDWFLNEDQPDLPDEFKEAYGRIVSEVSALRVKADKEDVRIHQFSRSLLSVFTHDEWRPMLRAKIALNFLSDLHRDHHFRSSRWLTAEAMALLASAISLRTGILVTPEQLVFEGVQDIEITRVNDPVLDHGPPRVVDVFIRTKNQAEADEIRAKW